MDFKMFISLPAHYKPKAFYFPGEIKTVPQENIFPVTFPPPLLSDQLAEKGGIYECTVDFDYISWELANGMDLFQSH